MKYICTEDGNGIEEVFTFPKTVDHDCMAEVLNCIKNHTTDDWKRIFRAPVSAGFVTGKGVCIGESITLNLKSRPEDTEILRSQVL